MAKILLVEDDNNLREIYEARFQAEGYEIVSAHDGEEALVVAKAEKPDLVISDVMMPKISGFEMLDILRNTDTLKNVKVIMLTALGQSDDQQRADKLGADKYLVKSQVTLEDIVNVANELLSPGTQADVSMPSTPPAVPAASPATTVPTLNAAPEPSVAPVTDISVESTLESSAIPANKSLDVELAEPANQEEKNVSSQIENFMNNTDSTQAATTTVPQPPTDTTAPQSPTEPSTPSITPPKDQALLPEEEKKEDEEEGKPAEYSPQPVGKKVIEPLSVEDDQPDINDLLAREKVVESIASPENKPTAEPSVTASAKPMTQEPTSQKPTDPTTNTFDANDIAL